MWAREIMLGFLGLASGFAVSAAVFAFVITLGIIPRFAAKSRTSSHILTYENAIFLGGVCGNLISVFGFCLPFGLGLLCIFGLSAGIYTGCLAVALAEILNTFPIMFRRTKMKEGQNWVLVAMALGKMAGAFYFYANHMAK
ncbi:MAG: stage V sporulation protein AB [Lachnospiraceae bacterium]|nr:stage V sporulation protein AB [Lachnospiraceae bacterium]